MPSDQRRKTRIDMKTIVETKLGPAGAGDLEGKERIVLFSVEKDEFEDRELSGDELAQNSELSGVFCKGVQYYDFSHVRFINNNSIANLIALLRSLLKQGRQVQLVNVSKKIRDKFRALGLEHIIKCR
jgi:ABC-type transporter Mla MlaB component